ncbi:exopolyphosphatase [Candidatus Nitrotoga sp. M5]|uniref:exopolyphosphatase n=1 Tax=Candidatus Nitrotoga sp. M5 TaxID=2890409 RepID=UPI001EF4B735|nr:exopolyphosphatase [Candidatus Nitrotoga sp. M5]CAH1387555.1 Exopolyphosphatase [Candidatus Nitrotoga sp. M5]
MQAYDTIAAVDLGSNSFRLQVARVVEDQIYPLDSFKETVRLAAGLTPDKYLDDNSQRCALACLKRFGERLRGLPNHAVRVVGTNTFRLAKNAPAFLEKAEAALGFPIEIIAGREEARLIYLGVAHCAPPTQNRRLVVDIGGGSTECVIGEGLEPLRTESLYMGCVSYSKRFFGDGKITKDAMHQAELAARMELQSIRFKFLDGNWQEAIGSSGTARALADLLKQNDWSNEGISAEGLAKLRSMLLKAGECKRLDTLGLKPDRIPVLPGGFAIMSAVFSELNIQHMSVASTALKEGVLYDLLGRLHHQDMRDVTVNQFMRRYHIDPLQAKRVEDLSLSLFKQVTQGCDVDVDAAQQQLQWAAMLHEIGISIAHSGYQKHAAYILENADMPGFSKMEQFQLGSQVRAQRGSLSKVLKLSEVIEDWTAILALRLAVLFCRSRTDVTLPKMQLERSGKKYRITLDKQWIEQNPLTENALQAEVKEWEAVGVNFSIVSELI